MPRIRFRRITFCREPWIFKLGGKRVREFHDPMIEKRRPHFDRMRHAGAIHFGQDIVRQKVFLIEPEVSPANRRPPQASSCNDGIERRRQFRLNQGVLFLVVERSAPVNMGARRGHPAAFQEPLQLVFESDLVVRYRPALRRREQRPERGGRQSANGAAQAGWRGASGIRRTIRRRLLH